MRLGILIISASVLAGCGPAEPEAPVEPPIAIPAPPRIPEPEPGLVLSPMNALPDQTDQARAQAEATRRELDQRAAALPVDIAAARQQAEDARRNAQPAEPPSPPTSPAPTSNGQPDAASPAAQPPPAPGL